MLAAAEFYISARLAAGKEDMSVNPLMAHMNDMVVSSCSMDHFDLPVKSTDANRQFLLSKVPYNRRTLDVQWYLCVGTSHEHGGARDTQGAAVRSRLEPEHGHAGARARMAHRPEARGDRIPPHHQRHHRGEGLPPPDLQAVPHREGALHYL